MSNNKNKRLNVLPEKLMSATNFPNSKETPLSVSTIFARNNFGLLGSFLDPNFEGGPSKIGIPWWPNPLVHTPLVAWETSSG
jgi:hypothetical protein